MPSLATSRTGSGSSGRPGVILRCDRFAVARPSSAPAPNMYDLGRAKGKLTWA